MRGVKGNTHTHRMRGRERIQCLYLGHGDPNWSLAYTPVQTKRAHSVSRNEPADLDYTSDPFAFPHSPLPSFLLKSHHKQKEENGGKSSSCSPPVHAKKRGKKANTTPTPHQQLTQTKGKSTETKQFAICTHSYRHTHHPHTHTTHTPHTHMQSLVNDVPPHWAPAVRPFLQRADEFNPREPLISYFLRTQVAFICMQKRTKEDKPGTAFLMRLLDALETEKRQLGDELDGVDGRTILTRVALMLFARADDEERTGKASMNLVRILYTSSVLFEATAQFTEDGKMDTVAAEKCKYAKYIAAKMKKAVEAGQPYVSPNVIEAPMIAHNDGDGGNNEEEEGGTGGGGGHVVSTAPPSSYIRKQQQQQQPPPPPMYDFPPPPPSYAPPHAVAAPAPARVAQQPPPPPPPQQQQQQQPSYTPPVSSGYKPCAEEMIDAQKFAKQAVSALQFYDGTSARAQLIAALNILDGKKR